MKVTNILFAMVIFSAIILGLSTFNADISNQYSVGYNDTSQLNLTANIDEIYDTSNQEMNSSDGGLGGGLFWESGLFVVKAPIRIAKLFFGTGTFFSHALTELSNFLSIPEWVTGLISASLGIVVIFAIIRLIWNKDY